LKIQQNTKIGKQTLITDSVIGKNVTIGNNTTIKNSLVFSDCVIGDNCFIENSIICYKNTLESDLKIINCYTESNLTIPSDEYTFSRITKDLDSESGTDIAFIKHGDYENINLADRDLLFLVDNQYHKSRLVDDEEEEFTSSEKEDEEEEDQGN